MVDQMTKDYRSKANLQRKLLLAMNIFQTMGMIVIIANVIHHW